MSRCSRLFIVLPSYSHINAVLMLAKRFPSEDVFFLGSPIKEFDRYIISQGLNLIKSESIPFGLNYFDELAFYRRQKKGYFELVSNRASGRLLETRKSDVQRVLISYDINEVYLDTFIGCDLLSYYKIIKSLGIEVKFLTTMNPLIYRRSSPLTNRLSLHWFSILKYRFSYLYQLLYLCGFSTQRLIDSQLKSLSLFGEKIKFYSDVAIVLAGYDEFFFSDELLTDINVSNAYFVGLNVDVTRVEYVDKKDRLRLKESLSDRRKLVFVSVGTLCDRDALCKMVNCIRDVSSKFFSYLFLIANVPEDLASLFIADNCDDDNIKYFGLLPQLMILKKTSIFITHGGFNSVKEALYFKVPMIVVSRPDEYDRGISGIMVESLKIGKYLDGRSLTAPKLEAALRSVEKVDRRTIMFRNC